MADVRSNPEILAERLREYLRGLDPHAQSELLREMDSKAFGELEISSAKFIEHELRALLRNSNYQQDRLGNPSRLFFGPIAPFLVTGVADHSKGQITRACLKPIWAWISRDLLPDATRDYGAAITSAAKVSNVDLCERVARAFQNKVVEFAEPVLAKPDLAAKARRQLLSYMAPAEPLEDLARILAVLKTALRAKAS